MRYLPSSVLPGRRKRPGLHRVVGHRSAVSLDAGADVQACVAVSVLEAAMGAAADSTPAILRLIILAPVLLERQRNRSSAGPFETP
jgi:hypothetical protein